MSDETKDIKAKKLAAARKKLKEYQKRGSDTKEAEITSIRTSYIASSSEVPGTQSAGSVSSNISEKSDSETNSNHYNSAENPNITHNDSAVREYFATENAEHYNDVPFVSTETKTAASFFDTISTTNEPLAEHNLNAIQVLISEKSQLNSDLNKYKSMCKEKDLELEEINAQYNAANQRLNELQQRFLVQQESHIESTNSLEELRQKLLQTTKVNEEQVTHLNELKKQLELTRNQISESEQRNKDISSELEMAQIRLRQLSDEANCTNDNRVELLTQTKFMHEQQIRDLQAMVQQLTQDREQSNVQYQNYVQHLNVELTSSNEKNAELTDECAKLAERERQLVEHVSELEREIQKNITRQGQFNSEVKQESDGKHLEELEKKMQEFAEEKREYELEKHEFQLKIKSQEDRLEKLTVELQQKEDDLEKLQTLLENINEEKPDQSKLLATMESDKVAASRALMQNVELKKQLDELELRFVQLTNDKADLMNRLDAELFANRDIRSKFSEIDERLKSADERFKFKDEEMIRLSHENMELTRKNLVLQQQVDRLQHFEVKEYNNEYDKVEEASRKVVDKMQLESCEHDKHEHSHDHHNHDHHSHDHHSHHHHNDHHHSHDQQNINNSHSHCEQHSENNESSSLKTFVTESTHQEGSLLNSEEASSVSASSAHIPTFEAVEKLQTRFTQLMSQVADLTDEKQRLEHLVLQLQGETETIGEYITLYQTQRRMLKQREYEKAAQMRLLQEEREKLREKVALLNNLVQNLCTELPQSNALKEQLNAAVNEELLKHSNTIPSAEENLTEKLLNIENENLPESRQILSRIQNILSEINDNTKEMPTVEHSVDHLNCCLGKFETV